MDVHKRKELDLAIEFSIICDMSSNTEQIDQ